MASRNIRIDGHLGGTARWRHRFVSLRRRAGLVALASAVVACSGGAWEPGAEHDAVLMRSGECGHWSVTFDDGPSFRATEAPPVDWRDRPVQGSLRIESDASATFTAEGIDLRMFGSGTRDDVGFAADCPGDPPA